MLGSESIEEMFDQPEWSEDDIDEKDANSESLLPECEKNVRYLPDEENGKDAEGENLGRY